MINLKIDIFLLENRRSRNRLADTRSRKQLQTLTEPFGGRALIKSIIQIAYRTDADGSIYPYCVQNRRLRKHLSKLRAEQTLKEAFILIAYSTDAHETIWWAGAHGINHTNCVQNRRLRKHLSKLRTEQTLTEAFIQIAYILSPVRCNTGDSIVTYCPNQMKTCLSEVGSN